MSVTDEGVVITVVGIRCSLCKRKIQQSVSEDATQADLDSVADEIHRVHMKWHENRLAKGIEATPTRSK